MIKITDLLITQADFEAIKIGVGILMALGVFALSKYIFFK